MDIIKEIKPPEEGLVYTNENIQLKIGEQILEAGVLYITNESLMWKPRSRNEGLCVPWQNISLHGISSNPKYVYVMLDQKLHWEGVYDPGSSNMNGNSANNANNGDQGSGGGDHNNDHQQQQQQQQQNALADGDNDDDSDEGNESDCEPHFTELWLIPSDLTRVDEIFQAMKDCQALHPDSISSDISDESNFMDAQDIEDDENDHHGDDDDDNNDNGNDVGQGDMKNLNINDEKFADAEE